MKIYICTMVVRNIFCEMIKKILLPYFTFSINLLKMFLLMTLFLLASFTKTEHFTLTHKQEIQLVQYIQDNIITVCTSSCKQ